MKSTLMYFYKLNPSLLLVTVTYVWSICLLSFELPPILTTLAAVPTVRALTITTFNILAPVHRSMTARHRESEREDWWRPRAESVARHIADNLATSDIILLQEWWFDEQFSTIFQSTIGHLFHISAERRPLSSEEGTFRDDGMCCLVRKGGRLDLIRSDMVLTGPQRIAQILHCRERCLDGSVGRDVFLANSHLSFPGDVDPLVNNDKQAREARIILSALSKASDEWGTSSPTTEVLEVIGGDFNSDSCGLAASVVESSPFNFVNCASAACQQMLSNVGGRVNIGVTHCNHLGEKVSVDHIFLRKRREPKYVQPLENGMGGVRSEERCAALALGYLDTQGTRVLNVERGDTLIEGNTVISDHRSVTATIEWPRMKRVQNETFLSDLYLNVTMPLDPLEPAWGIVQEP